MNASYSRPLSLYLAVVGISLTSTVIAQSSRPTCLQGRVGSDGTGRSALLPYQDLAYQGTRNVTVHFDAAARAETALVGTDGVSQAIAKWNQDCGPAINNPSKPDFSFDSVSDAPSDRTVADDAGTPFDFNEQRWRNWQTTLSIEYRRGQTAPYVDGELSPAQYYPSSNTIVLWDVVPPGVKIDGKYPYRDTPVGRRFNFNTPWGAAVLEHEIGHSLGLGHDRNGAACDGSPGHEHGVMQEPLLLGNEDLPVSPYCAFINFTNDPKQPCAIAPGDTEKDENETHPCEHPGPRGGDGTFSEPGTNWDFCLDSPWLCSEGIPRWELVYPGPVCEWGSVESRSTDIFGDTWISFTYYLDCTYPSLTGSTGLATVSGPPTSLEHPLPGASVSGVVAIDGWSVDSRNSTLLEVAIDGAEIPWRTLRRGLENARACDVRLVGSHMSGCRPDSGFAGTINSTLVSNGPHTLSVSSTNSFGYLTVVDREIVVSNCLDTQQPTISLTSPANGATVSGTTTLAATAADNGTLQRVEFLVDGSVVATDLNSPYSASWNTVPVAAGSHAISAKAFDSCGNSRTSAVVNVTVNNAPPNVPPQVVIDSPAQDQVFTSGSLNAFGWATDSGGVPNLEFRVDGVLRTQSWNRGPRLDVCNAVPVGDPNCPNVGWGTTFDLNGLSLGYHTIAVKAFDPQGLSSTASRSIKISPPAPNVGPTAEIASPTKYRTVSGRVTFSGWVTDSDGIANIRMEVDGQAVVPTSPWTRIPWTGICLAGSSLDPACPVVGYKISFDSSAFADGMRDVRVFFRDSLGMETYQTRPINFRNNSGGTLVTRFAIEDTYVASSSPTTVFGAQSTVSVKGSSSDTRYGFFKFDLSGISGTLKSARLRLVPVSSAAPFVSVFKIDSGTWSQSSFTWNSLSSLTWSFFDTFFDVPANNSTYLIDITDAVTLGGQLSIGIATEAPNVYSLGSSENATVAYRPMLEIRKQ